tara:strand:+ start:322 stop:549 length:228 start_codon:yes stop_codon:yes gene_type:complete
MLAEVAEGEIDAHPSVKSTASSMCEDLDFLFGIEKLYYNGLEKDISYKMSLIRKKNRENLKPVNDLINNLKNWNE